MSQILIVEDDTAIAMALEDDLRLEGYGVEVVRDGEAAVQRAGGSRFDLILLDVMLPRKDGFDVCRALRRAGVSSMILLLTARSSESDKVLGLELGADDYVTKPYSPKELRARVRALLRRNAPGQEAGKLVTFGDCEIDLRRAVLKRAGQPVAVTPLEWKLLAMFVRRPGQVFTRRALIDEAWGADTAITERVVDNQIANLRKKIEAVPAEPRFLISVRSLGYRFEFEDVTQQ